jgi:molybdopterin/thiamine biosynthesis adenylyltransferase/DNA-directed RNA polymerase subunit RPC12/RpoP
MRGLAEVMVVDRDTYEEKNVVSQNVRPKDVGKRKAEVQARVLKEIDPDLKVTTCSDAVENIPMGRLQCNVLVACLDSRQARRYVNRIAWRLGIPWVDAGVEQGGLLARMNVYRPTADADAPCLECAWDERDYEMLSAEYSCAGGAPGVSATNAASGLGALAASLQALEIQKILDGQWEQVAVGAQILIEARHHHFYRSSFRRNPTCRFDHRTWRIRHLPSAPDAVPLSDAFRLGGNGKNGQHEQTVIRLEGRVFITGGWCPDCGHRSQMMCLEGRLLPRQKTCFRCGREVAVIEMTDKLTSGEMPAPLMRRDLSRLGLRSGDIVTVSNGHGEIHVQFGHRHRGGVK